MPLAAGARLGPYEILAASGAGAMGEVYRARDTKLNRDVAIKALPDLFARDPERLTRAGADEQEGAGSPDGRWLAYMSSASGRDEVYVRSVEGPGGTIPVSSEGGASPVWARKGDALYFRSGTGLMRAPVAGTPLQIGAPAVVQTLPPGTIGLDVAPDGRVLVVIRQDNADSRDFLHVLLHWSRTLR